MSPAADRSDPKSPESADEQPVESRESFVDLDLGSTVLPWARSVTAALLFGLLVAAGGHASRRDLSTISVFGVEAGTSPGCTVLRKCEEKAPP